MNLNFNLNPDSYSFVELANLLSLKKNYTDKDVIKSKQNRIKQLEQNKTLGFEERRNITFFIDTISEKLIINMKNSDDDSSAVGTWDNKYTPTQQYGSNIIITNPNIISGKKSQITEGRVAQDGIDAPPGYLNPINVKTISQTVNIDSRFRKEYYKTSSSDYYIQLTEKQQKVVSMKLSGVEIPTSWYAVSKSLQNNSFLIIDNDKTTDNAWLVTLPDGNYEQWWIGNAETESIIKTVNQAIALATPGTVVTDGTFTANDGGTSLNASYDITYTIDRRNGKSIFARGEEYTTDLTLSNNVSLRFNVDSDGNLDMNVNIQLKLGWMLGFRVAQYNIALPDDEDSMGAVSEAPCYIVGPRYGFISINDYQKNSGPPFILNYTDSSTDMNVISRINLAKSFQDNVGYQNAEGTGISRTREYFGPVDIQRLDIKFLDEFGRILDFNNMDWSFTLTFEKLYD
jgi:hypothetical protein